MSRRLYTILAAIGIFFFATALIGSLYQRDDSAINNKENNVKQKVIVLNSSLNSMAADQSLIDMLMADDLDNSQGLQEYFTNRLPTSDQSSLYVWNNGKLVYWNLDDYHMYSETRPSEEQTELLVKDNQAYIKLSVPSSISQFSEDRTENSRLSLLYVVTLADVEEMTLNPSANTASSGSMTIPGLNNYLSSHTIAVQAQFVYILYLFGYLFLISFILLVAHRLVRIYQPGLIIVALLLLLLILRGVGLLFPLSHPLLPVFFKPRFFSSHIPGSMADWILNVVIGFLFALFFYVHFPKFVRKSNRRNNQLLTFVVYLIFCLCTILFCFFVWAAVNNQYVHIDINIIEYLTAGNLLVLFTTFLLLLSTFIISIRLFMAIQVFEWPWLEKMGIFLLAVVVSTIFMVWAQLEINIWLWIISLLIMMLLFDLFLDSSMRDFTWVSVWLLILSMFSTVLFFHFYTMQLKGRSIEALNQKITIPDPQLISVIQGLDAGLSVKQDVRPSPESLLNDAIFTHSAIENGYQFSITDRPEDSEFDSFEGVLYRYQNKWPGVYLFSVGKGENRIGLEAREIGVVIEHFNKKKKQHDHVLFNTGDWTVYEDRKITNDESLFFPPNLDSISLQTVRDSQFVRDNTIYTLVEQGDRAALGRQEFDGILQPMSFFSFNFILSLLIISLLLILHKFIPFLPGELHQYFIENLSIRNKIQFSVLAILIAAFAMVGIVSANFYKRSYKETLEATVKEYYQKVKRSQFGSDEIIRVLEGIPGRFILFDQEGKAIQSNLRNTYSRLPYEVVRKINLSNTLDHFDEIWPGALVLPFSLNRSQTVFLAYPELTAVPEGFYRFINLLLNAFVFLLLISSALSFSISNTIISPLTELGSKLKKFSLGKRNEPISWKQPDELGTLIQSYNEMVEKLEQSAELLAHSEREVAWREMAKQVAHEIKNPLTPMKLSIQHMESRIREAEEDEAREIVHHVSKVLIEQIDNLSRIASEFSSFAKLPKPEYEEILLNDLVGSIYDLFHTRSNIRFNLYVPIDELVVQADRTHLIRVMNNLMKNAVQSIPDGREGHIVIRLKEHEGHALVMVEDNGKGIEDELREKVFFPNFTTKSSGTGLGLAICKNIIESFNGTIYFINNKPEGTVFIFELPLVN